MPLFVKSPSVDNLLIRLEALESSFISGLDFAGIFHSVAGMLQGKQYHEYSVKDRSPVALTQQTPNLLDYRILFLCNIYCLSLELVPCATGFGNFVIYFICVCLEAFSSEAEAAVLLNSKVVFTW